MEDIKHFEQWLLTLKDNQVRITPPKDVDVKLGDWDVKLCGGKRDRDLPSDFEWS